VVAKTNDTDATKHIPPSRGWSVLKHGVKPSPRVTFEVRSGSKNSEEDGTGMAADSDDHPDSKRKGYVLGTIASVEV